MGKITFDQPAEQWREALPIGNGRIGGMVFGEISKETIALNEDSIWYGKPVNRINPDAYPNLEKVREFIFDGKIPEAEQLLKYAFSGTPQSQRPYQSLGKLTLQFLGEGYEKDETGHLPFGHEHDKTKTEKKDRTQVGESGKNEVAPVYERILDMQTGVCKVAFQENQYHVEREYFCSYPDQVMVIHWRTDDPTGLSFSSLLMRERFYDEMYKMSDSEIQMSGNLGEGGIHFQVGIRAQVSSGSVKTIGEHLLVDHAKEGTLYLAVATSFYHGGDLKQIVSEQLEHACEKTYEQIREKHAADVSSYMNRMRFSLGDRVVEKELIQRYFEYGRYLLLSSSREGSFPANLQGIWNEDMLPSWDSKYTININTEMNYWMADKANMSECQMPLFELLKRMVENGRKTALEMYHCRGFVAHHNTDIWADTAPQDQWIPASYWTMGGAWLCTHLWKHFMYSQDKEWLKEEAYPIIKEAVLFFQDFLVERDGKLLTCPSVSPENTYILPTGVKGSVCAGATMDNQILRDLFTQYLKAAELLQTDEVLQEQVKTMLAKLPQNQIGKYGQIMEWEKDYEEMEPGHRHVSQLYGVFPSEQISPYDDPELVEAAKRTLERRLQYGGGHTGWSCAWMICLYARLLDGEKAYGCLQKLLHESTFPNLMDTHPRGDDFVFQIDGNFGACAGILEMLVQTYEDQIHLLPAIPKEWQEGQATGIKLPGGLLLNLSWCQNTIDMELTYRKIKQDSILSNVELNDNRSVHRMISYHGSNKGISICPGEQIKVSFPILGQEKRP